VRPEGKLKDLQAKYVRLRIVNMAEVDVGLFDFDFDTTFHTFVMNADEQIYLRYAGRREGAHSDFLSEASLCNALERGLAIHDEVKAGTRTLPARPKSRLAQSYPNVKRIVEKGQCVHCHQIAQAKAEEAIASPEFDRLRDVWIYPLPDRLGIELDPELPMSVTGVSGAARAAGMRKGDFIEKVGETAVATFADLQNALHLLPPETKTVSIEVLRPSAKSGTKALTIKLPEYWRVTNINWRAMAHTLQPFPEFWSKELDTDSRKKLRLKADGLASEVTKFWVKTNAQSAGLQQGDVVYEIDGVDESPYTKNAHVYIRLFFKPGDTVKVKAMRDSKTLEFSFKVKAKPW
jgi:hypothetical protein